MPEDSTTKPTKPGPENEPIKVTISIPQIMGGALAAATAAVIGSTLGVAGTIAGAVVASIVGGVAGTLYSAGIDRTHRKVSGAIQRGYQRVRTVEDAEDVEAEAVATGEGMPEAAESVTEPNRIAPPQAVQVGAPAEAKGRLLKPMALTAGAIFLVAVLAITAIELGLGRSLTGDSGTTVGQVTRSKPVASPTSTPTAAISEVVPTPTPTPVQPTPSVSPLPSEVPSASPSPAATGLPTPIATTS